MTTEHYLSRNEKRHSRRKKEKEEGKGIKRVNAYMLCDECHENSKVGSTRNENARTVNENERTRTRTRTRREH